MSEPRSHSVYLLDSDEEPPRLERQARLYGAEDELRHLALLPERLRPRCRLWVREASHGSSPAPCRTCAPRAVIVNPRTSTLHAGKPPQKALAIFSSTEAMPFACHLSMAASTSSGPNTCSSL
jgi:hypothetical protein